MDIYLKSIMIDVVMFCVIISTFFSESICIPEKTYS